MFPASLYTRSAVHSENDAADTNARNNNSSIPFISKVIDALKTSDTIQSIAPPTKSCHAVTSKILPFETIFPYRLPDALHTVAISTKPSPRNVNVPEKNERFTTITPSAPNTQPIIFLIVSFSSLKKTGASKTPRKAENADSTDVFVAEAFDTPM